MTPLQITQAVVDLSIVAGLVVAFVVITFMVYRR